MQRLLSRNTSQLKLLQRWNSSATTDLPSQRVYSWGVGSSGQLGHPTFDESIGVLGDKSYIQDEPRKLAKSGLFTQLACGVEYTLALDKNGSLYGWGSGFTGGDKKSLTPVLIPTPTKFVTIAAGTRHSAAIDAEGNVYTWGKGGDWMQGGGQLGHNSTESVELPKLVESFKEYGAKAKSVCCGSQHTHILTVDGEVLSCGVGELGRLGTGSNSDCLVPEPLDTLTDEDIVQVATGSSHSLALTVDGRVFCWGRNDHGQLGVADSFMDMYSMEAFPRHLEAEEAFEGLKIAQVACGKGRSAVIAEDGSLFLWGSKMQHVPTKIPGALFNGYKVVSVVCGGEAGRSCTAVLTEDGGLWTFGDARSRLLGRGGVSNAVVFRELPTPEVVPMFKSRKVYSVAAGLGQHMCAIVSP